MGEGSSGLRTSALSKPVRSDGAGGHGRDVLGSDALRSNALNGTAVEFRILGPVEVWQGGKKHSLDGSKQRTVLAALLLAKGRILSDERLSALLWGENPPMTAAAQLYTHVSRLRKLLGCSTTIRRHRPGYFMDIGTAHFDHAEFERLSWAGRTALDAHSFPEAASTLSEALKLWRGPALANVTEYLGDVELPGLEEARMVALESRIEADLALGRRDQLISELTGLAAAYPLRERLRGQLMVALYRSDRQGDALGVFHEGRRLLADELGVDVSPALHQLYQEILVGEPGVGPPPERQIVLANSVPPAAAAVAAADSRPATLPSDVADFTGRREQIKQLTDMLRPEPGTAARCGVAIITGMTGIGKSALALRTSHLCRDEFPDGQLYADLRDANGAPVGSFQVLGSFLRALGMAEREIPDDRAERIRCYRSHLAERRLLVVLDNAVSDRQVRALLPAGSGCAVLITSRSPLTTLEGAQLVDLEPLPPEESVAMLGAVIGDDRVAAEHCAAAELVELCGHLPMAVRVIGARLASGSHHSLGRLLHRLSDEPSRLDQLRLGSMDVRAGLEAGYRDLDARGRTALRRLALLDVPDFPSWVAAAVLEVGEDIAEDVVDALVGARLLRVVQSAPGARLSARYRLHPLVRLVARERAVAEEPAAQCRGAVDRAMGAWLATAVEVDRRLPGPRRVHCTGGASRWRLGASHIHGLIADPLDWFDHESGALVAVLEQAANTGRTANAWELAQALVRYFDLRGRHDEWRQTHQRAWSAARSAGDVLGQAVTLLGFAELSAVLGDSAARLSYAGQAGHLFHVLDRQAQRSEALVHCEDAGFAPPRQVEFVRRGERNPVGGVALAVVQNRQSAPLSRPRGTPTV